MCSISVVIDVLRAYADYRERKELKKGAKSVFSLVSPILARVLKHFFRSSSDLFFWSESLHILLHFCDFVFVPLATGNANPSI